MSRSSRILGFGHHAPSRKVDPEIENRLGLEPGWIERRTGIRSRFWATDRISVWKNRVGNLPLVAIGGLTVDRIEGVFAQGAQSAAVVTNVTRNAHPEARVLEWLAATAQR
ncbi:hypothetical protein [Mesorhizobium sp. M0622]|uniref:hypothetical protein n=1 Tax=Mesorhizobium sp. M0622 TaxID=2956975 RepID=UPI00333C5C03